MQARNRTFTHKKGLLDHQSSSTGKKRNAPPCEQVMADLPQDRLIPDKPPFSYVGIDYFGPLEVKRARSVVKRYGCIFSCLTQEQSI